MPTRPDLTRRTPADAVRTEFGTWYLNDELAPNGTDQLDGMARNSASSLLAIVGEAQRGALTALLRELRHHRDHPLTRAIEDETLTDRTSADAHWRDCQRLLTAIETAL